MSDDQPTPDEIMESDASPEGDLGVSSERVGPTGPGQVAATGVRNTRVSEATGEDVPPEQRPGAEETNPDGIPPKASPEPTTG